ncbi:hypothetical protein GLOTRDRAFT_117039 [Gloeophyllum trabeum ATCC 11539]|uniref:E3 ubiquitin-protein ligase listerin n=1 Tax=Gloeophyllum trabeum (strain ATCC 11539 / FP-39264 / Madison 617) TaxID=670483 RepID=S7RHD0_GLOTA|nr:uncharacterized protein GLOTRDRAFT_117039 [Gloeophyllum trabeum ATCC 11539]EPQ53690.1 hypothetical protein GLOTRDRAFT_117039 [Gloeophyllum trabeum ATCC 11539]
MGKGQKSSASSGTRKKHARKAAGPQEPTPTKDKRDKGTGKGKGKNKEPRKKVYIPPTKPAPARPDPLDTLGLANQLPPELLVVLRSLRKKDAVTKAKALEELLGAWVERALGTRDEGAVAATLVLMLPVWVHHMPALFLHPSRRIRLLAASVHSSLLRIPDARAALLTFLADAAPPDQAECVLGAWCMAGSDADRLVARHARASWEDFVSLAPPSALALDESALLRMLQRTALDPGAVYLSLNPPQVSVEPGVPGRKAPPKRREEEPVRAKTEDEEESEDDRNARLRVGALGGLKWVLGLAEILGNPALWTSLSHARAAPWVDVPSFGCGQPVVRRAAWALVQALVGHWAEEVKNADLLGVLSTVVLRSAWVEPDPTVRTVMWQPLMMFLKEFPQAWTVDGSKTAADDASESDGDHSDEEDGDREQGTPGPAPTTPGTSLAYDEFLQFLQLGCAGSPLQGYPTVVIVLSTLPASFLSTPTVEDALKDLFTSFWAAVDARALGGLDKAAAHRAFLSSLLECTAFLVRRIRQDPAFRDANVDAHEVRRWLVGEQSARVMEALAGGGLRVEGAGAGAGALVGRHLEALEGVDIELFRAAWAPVDATLARVGARFACGALKAFWETFGEGSEARAAARRAIGEVARRAVGEAIDETVQANVAQLVDAAPSLLLAYLTHRNDQARALEIWRRILDVLSGKDPRELATRIAPFARAGALPCYCAPEDGELDEPLTRLVAHASGGSVDSEAAGVVCSVLRNPQYFLSSAARVGLVEGLVATFGVHVQQALRDPAAAAYTQAFENLLGLLEAALAGDPAVLSSSTLGVGLLPDLCLFAYVLPTFSSSKGEAYFEKARDLWNGWWGQSTEESRSDTQAALVGKLRDIILDTQVAVTPDSVLDVLWDGIPGLDIQAADVLPDSGTMLRMLEGLPTYPEDPSAAVVNNLIPPASLLGDRVTWTPEYDSEGYSQYGRVTTAFARVFASDRQAAKEHIWALQHLLAASVYAEDQVQLSLERNPLCTRKVSRAKLQAFVSRVQSITAYLLVPDAEDGWHSKIVNAAQDPAIERSTPSTLTAHLIQYASGHDNPREARVLYAALQTVMSGATKEEADEWIMLARKLEKKAPLTSIALVSCVTAFGPEPPRLDRYRNELAAGIFGVPASKANDEGLLSLLRLAATAPDPESDVVFLPQPRAINLMKACQQWVESDEDISEDVESAMTLIFYHLVPILQDVPGGHWDFIFDVIENNLENGSFNENSTLVTLARTFRLIIAIQDIATTNKSLRALWDERRQAVLTLVRDLIASRESSRAPSTPQLMSLELAMSIVQDMPDSLHDAKILPSMCRLIVNTSSETQKMAYHLLQESSRKYTENLVIEAGVDTEANVKCELPMELVDILQRSISDDDPDDIPQDPFGYFLAWMAVFDLFSNASFKVKSGYIQHLRDLDLISTRFLPYIFNALGLYGGPRSTFKLDVWAVDEYHVSLYDPDVPVSAALQAAHLYYRGLLIIPSLIRAWLQDCKDRTLSTTVTTFTAQHYSPVIIATEFARVKSPDAASELEHENLAIKVAGTVNEITASWAVDEHQLEISLKLPADWPLHPVQVRDSKKVGVEENRWRAWVLGVQQIMWTQNGSIVDGLSLFKRNVSLHFEGQVECAICYSIISPMDYSLPKKPCKTCKNRFHSTCLYKWFNTSHSSTCPLCRSDIF